MQYAVFHFVLWELVDYIITESSQILLLRHT